GIYRSFAHARIARSLRMTAAGAVNRERGATGGVSSSLSQRERACHPERRRREGSASARRICLSGYISPPMTRRFRRLAWAAAACTYLLIVLGAVVRVTGSGLGCGEHWPRCHGRWFPPLNDIGTLIEWNHRLFAGLVSVLVAAVAA